MRRYDNYSERELVSLLTQGDAEALSRLYYIHAKQLICFITKVARSPFLADDIVHDTFMKIWDTRHLIDPGQSFKSYLYTVARHHLLNLLKRASHERAIVEEIRRHTSATVLTTELAVNYKESSVLFNEAITSLPARCREVFVLCRLQGVQYKQAASQLGITESTVNNQMVKALKHIRTFITDKNALTVVVVVGVGVISNKF